MSPNPSPPPEPEPSETTARRGSVEGHEAKQQPPSADDSARAPSQDPDSCEDRVDDAATLTRTVPLSESRRGVPPSSAPREITDPDHTLGEFRTVRPSAVEEVGHDWSAGQLVADRFRIARLIGQGGMGKVYLAKDETLGRFIALKRVPQQIIFDGDARDDLRQETNRLLDLAHENVVRVHTYYDEPAWPFFAMEYLEGPTLKTLLRERKGQAPCFSVPEILEVARQVGAGLQYAHSKGLVHRDLKPANLMFARPVDGAVTSRDTLKITDFGISRVVADSTLRNTGMRSGTIPYMSPEQYQGEECTPRNDIYSLGVTLYELLAGKPPFATGDIGFQILNLRPRAIPGVPRWLNAVIARALEKAPDDRFGSVKEFNEALTKRSAYPRGISLRPFLRRAVRPAIWTASVAAVLCVLFLAAQLNWGAILQVAFEDNPRLGLDPRGPLASGPTKLSQKELTDLRVELQRQLDRVVESPIASKRFQFEVRRQGPFEDLTRGVFDLLYFDLVSNDAAAAEGSRTILGVAKRDSEGNEIPNARIFDVEVDSDGQWILRARFKGDYASDQDALAVTKTVIIDTTAPDFEVSPAARDSEGFEFVDSENGRFVTFKPNVHLQLVNASDSHTAWYQRITENGAGTERPILDTLDWQLTDLPVGQSRFLVHVEDILGNTKEETIAVERLALSAPVFEKVKTEGNRVLVTGTLKHGTGPELKRLPTPTAFVNGELVDPPYRVDKLPTLRSPTFEYWLELPRFSNTIEVKARVGHEYLDLGGLSNVEVAPPDVILDHQPPDRQDDSIVNLSGEIVPYFRGLMAKVNVIGRTSIDLSPRLTDDPEVARFQTQVDLRSREYNEFWIELRYDGQVLNPNARTMRVYYDVDPPEVVDGIKFDMAYGENLHVYFEATEPLARARVRREDGGDWEVLTTSDGPTSYRYVTPMPVGKPVLFEIELTDLVGHENRLDKVFEWSLPDDDVSPGDIAPQDVVRPTPGVAREGAAEARPASARDGGGDREGAERRIDQNAFLESAGINFRSFGREGAQMMATEMPQRIWNSFLHRIGRRESGEGPLDRPMAITARFDPVLLEEFVKWFNDRCQGDGYEYYVPTTLEWKQAFTGSASDDPLQVDAEIVDWFRGEREDSRFTPFPEEKYAQNELSSIGARKENRTPTGLLDMESNLQEIVRGENGSWWVIGGWNRLHSGDLREQCLTARKLSDTLTSTYNRWKQTGLRLARRPRPLAASR